MWLSANGN
jgi:hypothetical protein